MIIILRVIEDWLIIYLLNFILDILFRNYFLFGCKIYIKIFYSDLFNYLFIWIVNYGIFS